MKNSKDSLGNRMKNYENISRIYLTKKSPVIIRIDGKAFHTFTRGLKKPFDPLFMEVMQIVAQKLCATISGCKLAYIQSDEISLLLTDYDTTDTQPWFDNNLQKLVSVSASIATLAFNKAFEQRAELVFDAYSDMWNISESETKYRDCLIACVSKGAMFDARAFILPKEEVCNYFIWRQQDATRNSILSVAQSVFSAKEMQGKKCNVLQDMLFTQKSINWNECTATEKRGSCVIKTVVNQNGVDRQKWVIDNDIPIFTADKNYIEKNVFFKKLEA